MDECKPLTGGGVHAKAMVAVALQLGGGGANGASAGVGGSSSLQRSMSKQSDTPRARAMRDECYCQLVKQVGSIKRLCTGSLVHYEQSVRSTYQTKLAASSTTLCDLDHSRRVVYSVCLLRGIE